MGMIDKNYDDWKLEEVQGKFENTEAAEAVEALRKAMKRLTDHDNSWQVDGPIWKEMWNARKEDLLAEILIGKGSEGFAIIFKKEEETLNAAWQILDSLTAAQALSKSLEAGQTRATLVKKVKKGILKWKWHSFVANVATALDREDA